VAAGLASAAAEAAAYQPLKLPAVSTEAQIRILRDYWGQHSKERQTAGNRVALDAIVHGIERGHISLEVLVRQARFRSLLEEQASELHRLRAGAGAQAESTEGLDMGQGGSCPRYDGRTCNGKKSGVCRTDKCACLGGWSGVACQLDPELAGFDVNLGTAEPTIDCVDKLLDYQTHC